VKKYNRSVIVSVLILPIFLSISCGGGGSNGGDNNSGTPNPSPAVKRIFVTKATYNGNMGGLTGADNLCNSSAAAAGLGGTWKAWLSDASSDAINRIIDVGPWYLIDGSRKVFENKNNLTTSPLVPINMDEYGGFVGGEYSWTDTYEGIGVMLSNGGGGHCLGWTDGTRNDNCTWFMFAEPQHCTGIIGSTDAIDYTWSLFQILATPVFISDYCDSLHHLYCLEQ